LVSSTPDLQPAVPAVEVARLVKLLGVSSSVLRGIAAILLLLATGGFVVALFSALGQRQREVALLRTMGASSRLVVTLVALEGVALGAIGGVMGIVLSRALLWFAAVAGRDTPLATLALPGVGARELIALTLAMACATFASLPAAWRASRLHPALVLARS
jgi:putative ABC transport system permease protein